MTHLCCSHNGQLCGVQISTSQLFLQHLGMEGDNLQPRSKALPLQESHLLASLPQPPFLSPTNPVPPVGALSSPASPPH